MRISAAYEDGFSYRVYDYPGGGFRDDLVWVDDVLNQVGVGYATRGWEFTKRVEQRKCVLILPPLKWIALDLPEEEEELKKGEPIRKREPVFVSAIDGLVRTV